VTFYVKTKQAEFEAKLRSENIDISKWVSPWNQMFKAAKKSRAGAEAVAPKINWVFDKEPIRNFLDASFRNKTLKELTGHDAFVKLFNRVSLNIFHSFTIDC
jgi:hypothetical protein